MQGETEQEHLDRKVRERELLTVGFLCSALSNICAAPSDMVVDALTGKLWDEDEAASIKSLIKDKPKDSLFL